ncbi:hypothetical protein AB4308_20530, partial [Vibrio breoganii]
KDAQITVMRTCKLKVWKLSNHDCLTNNAKALNIMFSAFFLSCSCRYSFIFRATKLYIKTTKPLFMSGFVLNISSSEEVISKSPDRVLH